MRGYNGVPVKLTQEFGDWLASMIWDIWFTGTFGNGYYVKDSYRARVRIERWLYGQFCNIRRPISHVLAIEKFHQNDFVHGHMLIRGIGDIPYVEIGDSWRKHNYGGMCKVMGYDIGLGANYYITKYTTKDMMDWNIQIHPKHKNHELDPQWLKDSAKDIINDKR
jgi:hypothetical protein